MSSHSPGPADEGHTLRPPLQTSRVMSDPRLALQGMTPRRRRLLHERSKLSSRVESLRLQRDHDGDGSGFGAAGYAARERDLRLELSKVRREARGLEKQLSCERRGTSELQHKLDAAKVHSGKLQVQMHKRKKCL
eukprot:TRINITY_DN31487_c0_g1_i1.p1 TRINITY_DN31487_c0_g1~~TRINITY_DN31487_c0_g1_i1.p1  ORF type:complete len:135 (-),score=18.87 TRINITY_DN31487_c0_g1_i1:28-432(-)